MAVQLAALVEVDRVSFAVFVERCSACCGGVGCEQQKSGKNMGEAYAYVEDTSMSSQDSSGLRPQYSKGGGGCKCWQWRAADWWIWIVDDLLWIMDSGMAEKGSKLARAGNVTGGANSPKGQSFRDKGASTFPLFLGEKEV